MTSRHYSTYTVVDYAEIVADASPLSTLPRSLPFPYIIPSFPSFFAPRLEPAMPSRWWLYIQAVIWRSLACVGMFLHSNTAPYPPSPSFKRTITLPADGSGRAQKIVLHFYCPNSYVQYRKEGRLSPVVVNFHGGGFTLGTATDDCRWAQCVLDDADAVMVSVSYRLAPESPFPAAVDDGVESLVYLTAHAAELGLDMTRVALSGFSAGGNLAVTVPLRLRSLGLDTRSYNGASHTSLSSAVGGSRIGQDDVADFDTPSIQSSSINLSTLGPPSPNLIDLDHSPIDSHLQDHLDEGRQRHIHDIRPPSPFSSYNRPPSAAPFLIHDDRLAFLHNSSHQHLPLPLCKNELRIRAIFCWYPILDFQEPRENRRALSIMPSKTLPAVLTTLFDESYLPDRASRSSPFASPSRASDELLAEAIPHHVFLYVCEWDMLLREGQEFVRRLHDLGKHVRSMMIEKVCHAWDKSPNPFRNQADVFVLYRNACADMRAIFAE